MDSLYPPPRSHTATDGHKKGQKSRQPGLVSTSKKGQQLKVKKSCQPSLVSTRNSARLSKRALSSQSEFRVDVWDKETAPTRLNGKEKDPGRLLSDFVHQEALLQGKDPSFLLPFSSWELNVRSRFILNMYVYMHAYNLLL